MKLVFGGPLSEVVCEVVVVGGGWGVGGCVVGGGGGSGGWGWEWEGCSCITIEVVFHNYYHV